MSNDRLLVVDDEGEFGTYVAKVAEDLGYATRVALGGREFQKVFEEFAPTHVVIDIVMPDMDGIELVRWLVEIGASCRVILVSAYNPVYAKMAKTLAEDLGHLEVAYEAKPVRLKRLRELLSP